MKKIIFDTDLGVDCDDTGALALIHSLVNDGEAKLLAVTHCFSTPYVAGAIDCINRYYNNSVPVGVNHAVFYDTPNTYAKALSENFDNSYPPSSLKNIPDSHKLIRKILAEQEDKSVTLVATGTLATLALLVNSQADDISPLSGKELISKKVERTVIMGGRFFETWKEPIYADNVETADYVEWEWNIHEDINSAKIVCDEWPKDSELVFSSYEIGCFIKTLIGYSKTAPKTNPVRLAYEIHSGDNGRCSWDLTAVLEAIRPSAYWNYQEYGTITVDDNGVTKWTKNDEFKRTYLLPKTSDEELVKIMDELILKNETKR